MVWHIILPEVPDLREDLTDVGGPLDSGK